MPTSQCSAKGPAVSGGKRHIATGHHVRPKKGDVGRRLSLDQDTLMGLQRIAANERQLDKRRYHGAAQFHRLPMHDFATVPVAVCYVERGFVGRHSQCRVVLSISHGYSARYWPKHDSVIW